MKLQIISRLSQQENARNKQTHPSRQQINTHLLSTKNILAEHIDQYLSTAKPHRDPTPKTATALFKAFEAECVLKYQSVPVQEVKPKRRLEIQLRLMAKKQEANKQNIPINAFTFAEQQLRKPVEPYEFMSTEPTHDLNNYYVMQLKPKNKIRKFNSLISIKPGDGRDDTRKPGFIMKRNLSVSKKQHDAPISQDRGDDEGRMSKRLRRVESRQALERVDEQISQSKERIAKIRKELNQIYQSSKGVSSYRLKLF